MPPTLAAAFFSVLPQRQPAQLLPAYSGPLCTASNEWCGHNSTSRRVALNTSSLAAEGCNEANGWCADANRTLAPALREPARLHTSGEVSIGDVLWVSPFAVSYTHLTLPTILLV